MFFPIFIKDQWFLNFINTLFSIFYWYSPIFNVLLKFTHFYTFYWNLVIIYSYQKFKNAPNTPFSILFPIFPIWSTFDHFLFIKIQWFLNALWDCYSSHFLFIFPIYRTYLQNFTFASCLWTRLWVIEAHFALNFPIESQNNSRNHKSFFCWRWFSFYNYWTLMIHSFFCYFVAVFGGGLFSNTLIHLFGLGI